MAGISDSNPSPNSGPVQSGIKTAAITDFTDSTSGDSTVTTLAAGVGKMVLGFHINLADITGAGDVVTTFTPGFHGQIDSVDFIVGTPVTTAAKAATLNLEIGTTNVTGGAVALTSAAATPLGAEIAGSAVTALNTFDSDDTISVEAASVTAFAEGDGMLLVTLTNLDTADAVAALNARVIELTTALEKATIVAV